DYVYRQPGGPELLRGFHDDLRTTAPSEMLEFFPTDVIRETTPEATAREVGAVAASGCPRRARNSSRSRWATDIRSTASPTVQAPRGCPRRGRRNCSRRTAAQEDSTDGLATRGGRRCGRGCL